MCIKSQNYIQQVEILFQLKKKTFVAFYQDMVKY